MVENPFFSYFTNSPRGNAYQNHKAKYWALLILLALTACTEQQPTINIAVASNFEQTLKSIVQQYPDKTIKINIITGSSGVLANQITNNAPYDLFLSADTKKPKFIHKNQPSLLEPEIYAIGQLALWIPHHNIPPNSSSKCIDYLNQLETLVIANPKTAPYGSVAEIVMNKHHIKVKKLIHAANISQSFLYTKDKFTQAGFVAYSMLKGNTQGCQQIFEHRALSQSMILLDNKAKGIYQYILSKEIQLLIKESGYNITN